LLKAENTKHNQNSLMKSKLKGGTVFLTLYVPASITLKSTAGGSIVAPCVPYQP